jgi:predicted nucleic acid-binding protein
VDVFLDTSVLVAASEQSHPHFARAKPALARIVAGQDRGFMSQHSVAEVYAVLTRLPVRPRITAADAVRIIRENILANIETVPLTPQDYLDVIATMEAGGWVGAKIYGALLLRCAATREVERIYTFNVEDFVQLAPAELRARICAP